MGLSQDKTEDRAHVRQQCSPSHTYCRKRCAQDMREDIADKVPENTFHHSVGCYIGTSYSHPSSFLSRCPAPPSNPPLCLLLQPELASNTHHLSSSIMDLCHSDRAVIPFLSVSLFCMCVHHKRCHFIFLLYSLLSVFQSLVHHPPHFARCVSVCVLENALPFLHPFIFAAM